MSIDFKLERNCDHRVVAEEAHLDADRQTIRLPRVITNSNLLMRVNGIKVSPTHAKWGYTLANDEYSVLPDRKKKVVLKAQSRATDDLIEMSYYTKSTQCPKCQGLSVYNDVEWDQVGRPVLMSGDYKLLQEVKKGVVTVLGSNPFHSWVGTRILQRIGSKVSNLSALRLAIVDEIASFITNYQNIQKKQIEYGQEVTPAETFVRLIDLKVDAVDPLVPIVFNVLIRFQNAAGKINNFALQLVLPQKGIL